MRSTLDTNPDIPILIGCGGTPMIKLAAEIADGWFPLGFALGMMKTYAPMLEEGFKKAGNGKGFHNFDIWLHVDVNVHEDVREAMRPFKEYVVQWAQLGREQMGMRCHGDLADRLIELQRAGRRQEAIDAVPDEYIDEGWLVGPLPGIGQRFKRWLDSGATGIIIRHGPQLTDTAPPEHLAVYTTIARAAGK